MAAVQEDWFTASDGLRLFERRWLPPVPASAALVFVHGFTEHAGRYDDFATKLSVSGCAVYTFDLRGHGRSEGARVWVRSVEVYMADLLAFIRHVATREPGIPLFLYGFSMGGTIAALVALQRPPNLAGLVLAAAGVRMSSDVYPWLRRFAAVLSRIVPWLRALPTGGDRVSRDPAVVADFENDPLVFHGRFPIRTGAEILAAARRVEAGMNSLDLPLLVLHGTDDRLTDSEGSRLLYAAAASADKTLKLYPGLHHDLLHEPEKDQVVADVIAWLAARWRP